MTEFISEFFNKIFADNIILATILIAIIPMIELKGAIPFAMSKGFWGSNALTSFYAFLYSFLGSIIIVPILALCFKPLYNWLITKKFFKKIVNFFTGDLKTKTNKLNEQTQTNKINKITLIKMLEVFLFVAFPVPLTGVWSGTCLSIFLGLNFWQTCLSVILGNFVCGLIVTFLCMIFPNITNILFFIFIALIILFLLIRTVMHIKSKNQIQDK